MTKRRKRRGISESNIPIGETLVLSASPVDWLQAADDGEEKPKRFSMTAYTGGEITLGAFFDPIVFDIAGMQASGESTPILVNHDPQQIAGHADSVQMSKQTIKLSGVMSGGGASADEVVASAGKGFPWKASVGVNPSKTEFVEQGATAKANGRNFKGPVNIIRGSQLVEVSFVPIAADPKTRVSMAASAALNSEKEKAMDFEKWLRAQGFDPDTLTEEQTASLKAMYPPGEEPKPDPAPPTPETPPVVTPEETPADDTVAGMRLKAAAEATRIADINTICASDHPVIQANAIGKGWSKAETELAVLRAERPKAPAAHIHSNESSSAVLEAAMCQTLGLKETEKQFDDKTLQAAHTTYGGRVGLQQVLLQAASQNGYVCQPGQRITAGNLREVLTYATQPQLRAGGASTFSLPGILSNVANKELLAGFVEEDQAWREISVIKNVSDFKTVTSYRMLDDMDYEELPPDGVIKHAQLGEESITRKAKTYAKMFALTRTDIINDDLGAFDDLRSRLGRGAARKFNDVFWSVFIDNSAFFTAGRGNFIDGATTTLLTDFVGLQLGIDAFDDLESTAVPPATRGKRVGGTPDILLVPTELDAVSRQIFAAVAPNAIGDVNIYSGRFRPVKVTQLSESRFTGWSATAWYLLRPTGILSPMVVSFLNGVAQPTVESADADFNRLGIQFRGFHDFGADQAEFLAGIKSKGAA